MSVGYDFDDGSRPRRALGEHGGGWWRWYAPDPDAVVAEWGRMAEAEPGDYVAVLDDNSRAFTAREMLAQVGLYIGTISPEPSAASLDILRRYVWVNGHASRAPSETP